MTVNFKNTVKFIKNTFKKEIAILWVFSVLLGFALVVLWNKGRLPLETGDFVFISLLSLLVALYRPRWIFFLFISLVPFENIILASGFLPIQIRPYQFLGGILVAAMAILGTSKKLNCQFLKPSWIDWLVFSLAPLSFLPLLASSSKSAILKNNLILISFIVLYYLIRNFTRNRDDAIKTALFFIGSYIAVNAYGFYQVFAEKFGAKSFEIMFGRPNSTFAEPDWLGIYLCFALAVLLSCVHYLTHKEPKLAAIKNYFLAILGLLVFLDITLLVLTLSRSAWIGSALLLAVFLLLSFFRKTGAEITFSVRDFRNNLAAVLVVVGISLSAIHFGNLSKFDIFDRARSTATNEQKITIACNKDSDVPPVVSSIDELAKHNCQHINLEDIESFKSRGENVVEIYRKDPNVMTRGMIYRKSWEIIKTHPVLGVGFGTITQNLGDDERGAGLNESNIFLQVWAGCGILGMAAFIAVFGFLFIYSFRRISPVCPLNRIIGCPVVREDTRKTFYLFSVLGILALLVPNLFNAGLFMGIFWIGLALIISIEKVVVSSSK
ncbi:MAG: O-antigen ligase family protein [Parcubacteria group bacterium]|jgi:hypothetical protein